MVGLSVGYGCLTLPESVDLARHADAAGIGVIAAGDGFVENFALMGALAVTTSHARLLTSVVGWTRTPVTAALAATTLQDLSGGRYGLGLGAMPREWSEGWHDVDYARPVRRMRDYVAAVRAAWTSEPGRPISHDGPLYRIRGYERQAPARHPAPPVHLGVTLPRMTALAGEIADGVVFNAMTSLDWLRDVSLPTLHAGLDAAGRSREAVEVSRLVYVAIDDDLEAAYDLVRPALAYYLAIPYFGDLCEFHGFDSALAAGRKALARGDHAAAAAAIPDGMVDAFALAGPPGRVRERLEAYAGVIDWPLFAVPLGHSAERTRALADRIVACFGSG